MLVHYKTSTLYLEQLGTEKIINPSFWPLMSFLTAQNTYIYLYIYISIGWQESEDGSHLQDRQEDGAQGVWLHFLTLALLFKYRVFIKYCVFSLIIL